MRMLLYGMQSSGASVLAFALAQKPDSVAFVDIWNMFAAPELATDRDSVAKVVVSTGYSLEVHRQRFRPDVTLLVLRHPADTYDSLGGKPYANEAGLMDEKFALLEQVFRAGKGFDHIVYYEDFVFCPRGVIARFAGMGWPIGYEALLFGRSQREIQDANAAACPGIHERLKYGGGNFQTRGLVRDRVRFADPWGRTAHLPRLCPSLFDHYSALRAERGELWHVPSRAVLSCKLGAIARELAPSDEIPPQSERAGYRLRFVDGTPQSRITDTEIVLCPAAHGRETRLTLSGLPGRPFTRIRGAASAEHPLGAGTTLRVRIESAGGGCLAEQEFTLRHADMRHIDLAFEPQVSAITLSLGVRLAGNANSPDHSSIRIQDLRLEQPA